MALILMACPGLLAGQQFPAYTIPDSLLAGANEVVREEYCELEVLSEESGVIRCRKAVTLLSRDSEANALILGYDSGSKVKKLEARLYDARGREIRKMGKEEIRDFAAVDGFSVYQDNRLKALEANHHEYPYTLAYAYEMSVSGINFAMFPYWQIQEYRQSVEQASFVVRMPREIPLHYKALNLGMEPERTEDEKEARYTWRVRGLKAVQPEPYGPPASEVLPTLLTAAGRFRIGAYAGSMSSWQDFGAFIGQLFEGRDALPGYVAEKVRQLAADAGSDAEKITALYRYLQENMRYVSVQLGIGGWQPSSAAYVAENKYGDCKALSNFMKALLHEAGITAYPALIANGRVPYEVEDSFTYPLFNHAILYIPSEDMWLECTSSTFPAGYIGAGNAGRNTLLITPEGGRLKATPALNGKDNRVVGKTTVTLAENGAATVAGDFRIAGSRHEAYRQRSAYSSRKELEDWFVSESSLPALALESLDIQAAPDAPEAVCRYRATSARYASRAGKRLFIPLNAVRPLNSVPEEMAERRHPIRADEAFTEADTVVFHLPEGFQVESMPRAPVVVEVSFGVYEAKAEWSEGVLVYTRRLQLRRHRLPATGYEDFRSFYQEVAKADKAMAVLVEKKT